MSSFIYKLYAGADPVTGWQFNDPIFGTPPTLGACVPNMRRTVERGEWVFAISGNVPGYKPYVAGGFRVQEKINALEAHRRFPHYRLRADASGQVLGNVIVDENGRQNTLDRHTNFERRLDNYLVGNEAVVIDDPDRVEKAREQTLPVLSRIFGRQGNRTFDIIGRGRAMTKSQVEEMTDWLRSLAQ